MPLHRPLAEQHLAQAEDHILQGERHVIRQRQIITELASHGQDTTAARDLVAHFEQALVLAYGDRDRLRDRDDARGGAIQVFGNVFMKREIRSDNS